MRSVPYRTDMHAMSSLINDDALIDLHFKGPAYTWSGGGPCSEQIFERLDRCLVSGCWSAMFPDAILEHLIRASSDHCPILLHLQFPMKQKNHLFRFEEFWLHYRDARLTNFWPGSYC